MPFKLSKINLDSLISSVLDEFESRPFITNKIEYVCEASLIETRLEENSSLLSDYQHEIEHWQRAIEQEHTQRLLKAQMIGMFSQDFRNPLTVIQFSIDFVRDYEDRLSAERKLTHLNKIDGSVKHLIQMLDDMLLVASSERDYLKIQPESLELAAYVQSIVDEFASVSIDSHRVIFNNDIEGYFNIDVKFLIMFSQMLSSILRMVVKSLLHSL